MDKVGLKLLKGKGKLTFMRVLDKVQCHAKIGLAFALTLTILC
jgi:hypothetical protein